MMKTRIDIYRRYAYLALVLVAAFFAACTEEEELGPRPEGSFTVSEIEGKPNYFLLSSDVEEAFRYKWDKADGEGFVEGNKTDTAYFKMAGEYQVKMMAMTRDGHVNATQTIVVENNAPGVGCTGDNLALITGCDESQTWVLAGEGSLWVGPVDGADTWWTLPAGDLEARACLLNDLFIFHADGTYEFDNQGDFWVEEEGGSAHPADIGLTVGCHDAAEMPAKYSAWGSGTHAFEITDDQITVSGNGGFLGIYKLGENAGAAAGPEESITYDIVELTADRLVIEKIYDFGKWVFTFVPEGTEPGTGGGGGNPDPEPQPEPETSSLPIDFEGAVPPFNGFGGTTYQVVDNPDAGGINTSAKVGEYVKGTEGNWAGIETTLDGPLDFSTNTLIKYKVYSPVTGRALFKLESADGTADPIEVFAEVTKTNEWEELSFDFSGAAGDTYDKIAMFLDFDNNNGGTFYIDDIRQAAEEAALTVEALTGGDAKSWKLKPAAGSFGVGPAKGSDAWWPNGADISADKPCLFNDEFIFKTGGVYEYQANGDIFAEGYMGVAEGCQDESILEGTDAEPWASGTHSFTFTEATETEPAYITVTGTGAFIALPKAYNGGEYAEAPPEENASVQYEVLSYVKTASSETLSIAVDISGDGTGFWNFVLVAQ